MEVFKESAPTDFTSNIGDNVKHSSDGKPNEEIKMVSSLGLLINRLRTDPIDADKGDCPKVTEELGNTSSSEVNASPDLLEIDINYCKLCSLQLTSKKALQQHIDGVKHLKQLQRAKLRNHGATRVVAKKAVVGTSFSAYVASSEKCIVGLSFVTETLPKSKFNTMCPFYNCSICVVTTESHNMCSHIIGKVHRKNFLREMNYDVTEMEDHEIDQLCAQFERERGRNMDDVTHEVDDELYKKIYGTVRNAEVKKLELLVDNESQIDSERSNNDALLFSRRDRIFHYQHQPTYGNSISQSPLSDFLLKLSQCSIKHKSDVHIGLSLINSLFEKLVEYKLKNANHQSKLHLESSHRQFISSLESLKKLGDHD